MFEKSLVDKIISNPRAKSVVSDITGNWSGDARNDFLKQVIKSTDKPVQSALAVLAEFDEWLDISKIAPGYRVSALKDIRMQSIAKIWASVSKGKEIDASSIGDITELDAKSYYILAAPSRRIIEYDDTSRDAVEYLTSVGIDSAKLGLWVEQFLQPHSAWNNFLNTVDYPTDVARNTVQSVEKYCGYQDRAVLDNTLRAVDPFGQSELSPIDSCLLFGRSCYLYRGKITFFLVCAGAGGKALCIYVPKLNLIIDFKAGIRKFISVNLFSNLFAMLTMRFVRHRGQYNTAVTDKIDPVRRQRITLTMQQSANPAHHLWNFYPGLERIVRNGSFVNVSQIIFGGTEFYGPLAALYPEVAECIDHGDKATIIDPYPFSPNDLVLTVGGYFIPQSLKNRIIDVAKHCDDTGSRRLDRNFVQSRFPVIWVGMRVGDKSWLDQENGIANIANAILDKYPNALFVLDGFLTPAGRDDVSSSWAGTMNALRDLCRAIVSKIHREDAVVDLIGVTLLEGALIAQSVDVYLTPIGSTQHRIGWLSKADGLVYSSSTKISKMKVDRLPGAWEAEGSRLPKYTFGNAVEPGTPRGKLDRRTGIENIELDSRQVANGLFRLIEDAESREIRISTSVSHLTDDSHSRSRMPWLGHETG